jgi:DNA-binding response OmpR family regulator
MVRWLAEAGHCVLAAPKDHNPSMDMASPGTASLVIADISDPATASSTIRSLQDAYSAPILALSARFRRGLGLSSEAAERLCVGKVLPKPFTREELLAAVNEAAQRS